MNRFTEHRAAVHQATLNIHGPERVVANAVEAICIHLASEEEQSAASEESEQQPAGEQT